MFTALYKKEMSDSDEDAKEVQLKLVVVGDGACGKVCFLWLF